MKLLTSTGEIAQRRAGTLLILLSCAVACGDPAEPLPDPNRPPVAVGTIADVSVPRGTTTTLDVSDYFNDPEGGTLRYQAATSDSTVVSVSTTDAVVSLSALAAGEVLVTVTALDSGGLAAEQAFKVIVPAPPLVHLTERLVRALEGNTVTIKLVLSFAPPAPITVTYTLGTDDDPGTSDADAMDFSAGLRGEVEIATGASEAAIQITLNDDDDIEPPRESFTITLDEPPLDGGYDLGKQESMVGMILEGVCDRTRAVQWSIVTQSGATDCFGVVDSDLAMLRVMELGGSGLKTLKNGDFAGLSKLVVLRVFGSRLADLPPGVFSGLGNLRYLLLGKSLLSELPDGLFAGLASLETLDLTYNQLTELPTGVFVGLSSLSKLSLDNNPGAPFDLPVAVQRTDSDDLLAPSPGRVAVTSPLGAPFTMRIPLTVHGGTPTSTSAVLPVGGQRGPDVTVTRSDGNQGGTQVIAGPAPPIPDSVTGIRVVVTDPLVLFGTVPNRAPVALSHIPPVRLHSGREPRTVDLTAYFRDPDGDELRYEAVNENPDVVTITSVRTGIVLNPLSPGAITVEVTATDPGGLSARLPFSITVRASVPGSFDVDVILVGDVSERLREAFEDAADRWMSILAGTELPDVPLDRPTRLGCSDIFTQEKVEGSIDDLVVVASVVELDGPGGALAGAQVCSVREGSLMPFLGVTIFDKDDLDGFGSRELEEVILHEMGHVLGFGTLWPQFGLLSDPSRIVSGADAHFTGEMAIAAFDDAGGVNYGGGAKVPVENRGGPGSVDTHWREAVFQREIMSSTVAVGTSESLSAITIQSLADLGYTVDVSLAEPYRLPSLGAKIESDLELIDLGDDVLKGPIAVVDRNGRVVRVIER